jgi:hypothetical protein
LYTEFEKYCRSDNDLRRRLKEQNQNKQDQTSGRGNCLVLLVLIFNLEQQGSSQQRQQMQEAEQNKPSRKQYEGKKYNQGKNGNKSQVPRQRRQYCFFHGENKWHITRDCPDAKETQERIERTLMSRRGGLF